MAGQKKIPDPLNLGKEPELLGRPFYFYGGYVALSSDQKENFLEKDHVNYYKCIVGDLLETIEQLRREIDFTKDLAMEYREEKECLEAALEQVGKELANLREEFDKFKEDTRKKIIGLNNVNAQKMLEIKMQRE